MKNWTRDELILAFYWYCTKIPFTKIKYTKPEVVELANLIGRTPSAVAYKLVNFARLDPALQKRGVKGMEHGSKAEEDIWNEFNNNWSGLAYESELLLSKHKDVPLEELIENEHYIIKPGLDREALVKIRVNQSFFRKTVLESYNNKCCITGIDLKALLVASHIIPWSVDHENRVNPHNGICLNALHDRAFDNGLITITPDFKIKVSQILLKTRIDNNSLNLMSSFHDQEIIKPQRFVPMQTFLEYHNEKIFKG